MTAETLVMAPSVTCRTGTSCLYLTPVVTTAGAPAATLENSCSSCRRQCAFSWFTFSLFEEHILQ